MAYCRRRAPKDDLIGKTNEIAPRSLFLSMSYITNIQNKAGLSHINLEH